MVERTPTPDLHPLETAHEERASLLRIVRITFLVVFATVTVLAILDTESGNVGRTIGLGGIALKLGWEVVVGVAAALAAVVLVIDALTTQKKISTLISVFVGLIVAVLAAWIVGRVIDLVVEMSEIHSPMLVSTTKILVGIALAYLCVVTVLHTQDDFRLVLPYVEFAKQLRGPRPLLLDTSVLIDARIVDLCATGIVQTPVVIPKFVVGELQTLADSGDRLKRAKGRRGLDVIGRLQRTGTLDVSIDETPVQGKAVDQMLVEMARRMPATIVTADVALNRVAGIQGVRVLNLNEVANALKPSLVPGEQLSIRLIKPGEQPGQGVGYLEDGTMVVAEDGGEYVGGLVTLVVTSSLQTSAGRLIFGRIVDAGPAAPDELGAEEPSLPAAPGDVAHPDRTSTDAATRDFRPLPPREPEESNPAPGPTAVPPPRVKSPYPPNPPKVRTNPARNPRR